MFNGFFWFCTKSPVAFIYGMRIISLSSAGVFNKEKVWIYFFNQSFCSVSLVKSPYFYSKLGLKLA